MSSKGARDARSTLKRRCTVIREELRLEYTAKLRDEIKELRRELQAVVETSS